MINFEEDKLACPWYDIGDCRGDVHYNGHVNDPIYNSCHEETCPIIYWIEVDKQN